MDFEQFQKAWGEDPAKKENNNTPDEKDHVENILTSLSKDIVQKPYGVDRIGFRVWSVVDNKLLPTTSLLQTPWKKRQLAACANLAGHDHPTHISAHAGCSCGLSAFVALEDAIFYGRLQAELARREGFSEEFVIGVVSLTGKGDNMFSDKTSVRAIYAEIIGLTKFSVIDTVNRYQDRNHDLEIFKSRYANDSKIDSIAKDLGVKSYSGIQDLAQDLGHDGVVLKNSSGINKLRSIFESDGDDEVLDAFFSELIWSSKTAAEFSKYDLSIRNRDKNLLHNFFLNSQNKIFASDDFLDTDQAIAHRKTISATPDVNELPGFTDLDYQDAIQLRAGFNSASCNYCSQPPSRSHNCGFSYQTETDELYNTKSIFTIVAISGETVSSAASASSQRGERVAPIGVLLNNIEAIKLPNYQRISKQAIELARRFDAPLFVDKRLAADYSRKQINLS